MVEVVIKWEKFGRWNGIVNGGMGKHKCLKEIEK